MTHFRTQGARVRVFTALAFAFGCEGTTWASQTIQGDAGGLPQLSEEQPGLQRVSVTAQKREEDAQDVPSPIQVIPGSELYLRNLTSLEELTQTIIPGVHIGNAGLDVVARGIGSGENHFDEAFVSVLDGVYYGRGRLSSTPIFDVDRIEVLQGPQSTYVGDSSIAGAMNIISRVPGSRFDANGRLLYGQDGQYAAEGALGGPLTDSLSIRLAAVRSGENGWINNVSTDEEAPRENNEGGRLTIRYEPTAYLTASLKLEGTLKRIAGAATDEPNQWTNCPPSAPLSKASLNYGLCPFVLSAGLPTGLQNNSNTGLPGQGMRLSTNEDVLTVAAAIGRHTLTSVTGWVGYHYAAEHDSTSVPIDIERLYGGTNSGGEKYRQLSQEFRIASSVDQPLEYLAGIYARSNVFDNWSVASTNTVNGVLSALGLSELLPYTPIGRLVTYHEVEHAYAVFASLKWKLSEYLDVTEAFRENWISKDYSGYLALGHGASLYGGFEPFPTSVAAEGAILANAVGLDQGTTSGLNHTSRAAMPTTSLDYHLTSEVMTYLSYRRGYLDGGFDWFNPVAPTNQLEYGPERADVFDLGLKSTWNNQLRVNVDVFFGKYTGMQLDGSVYDPTVGGYEQYVTNMARSRSQGLELETEWAATRSVHLFAAITYMEARYTQYSSAPPTALQTYCLSRYVEPQCNHYPNPVPDYANLAGQPLDFAPRFSGNVGFRFGHHFHGMRLTTEVSSYFSSRYQVAPPIGAADPDGLFSELGNYVRLDGRLSLEPAEGHWGIDIIGNNLGNRIIPVSLSAKEEHRTVSLQLRYQL